MCELRTAACVPGGLKRLAVPGKWPEIGGGVKTVPVILGLGVLSELIFLPSLCLVLLSSPGRQPEVEGKKAGLGKCDP